MKNTKQPRTINPKPKPGPKAATLALKGPWEEAMAASLKKKRPPDGWPKPETKKRATKK